MRFSTLFMIILLNTLLTGCLNQLITDDVCLNDMHCFAKQKSPIRIRNRNIILFNPSKCKCTGMFKYTCGDSLCTKNQNKCNEKVMKLKSDEVILLGLRKCDS